MSPNYAESKYEQQVQQIYTLSDTHGTIQRRTSQLSFIVWSSLPTYDSQGTVSHTSKQKYFEDIAKWSVIPTVKSSKLARVLR